MHPHIRTFIRRCTGRMSNAGVPVVSQQDVARTIEKAAAGMAYYLGLSDENATLRAQAAWERRQRRRCGHPLSDGPVVQPEQAQKCLHQALKKGSCLLTLPFSGAALELLYELATEGGLPLILVECPALSALAAELGATICDLPRCHTKDVIKHVKIQVRQPQAVVYVSFPELSTLTTGTTANAAFLGKPCRFSLLEPLLCRYGLTSILTIGYFPSTTGAGPELVSCEASFIGHDDHAHAMTTLLRWLVQHLQASASVAPDDTLSWHHLYRASVHCHQIERHNRIEQLDAYFNAWRHSPDGMPDTIDSIATARLAALRHAKYNAVLLEG